MAERALVSIVREICLRRGITFTPFSLGWVLRLDWREETRWIVGYDFDLNTCTTHQLCKDKAACYDALRSFDIQCIEHAMFIHPRHRSYAPRDGTWRAMHELFERWYHDVVVKPNNGTGGNDVMRARTVFELEDIVTELFLRHRTIAFSPFVPIGHEYRFIVVDGVIRLAYEKLRPQIEGDGRSSRLQLMFNRVAPAPSPRQLGKWLADLEVDLDDVLPAGAVWPMNWRHNLAQGASVELLDIDGPAFRAAGPIVLRAARALNVRFASIDVVETSAGEQLVMEVNAGVMMESFVAQRSDGRQRAVEIYEAAIEAMFA